MTKKICMILLVAILAMVLVTGCNRIETATLTTSTSAGARIIDSAGREIKIPAKLERVIVLNTSTFNMLTAIGAGETVVGVNDSTQQTEPSAAKLPVFGTFKQPNVEKIIEARPDAVLGNSYINPAQIKQLEDAGITVICFEFYLPSILQDELLTLGKLFNKEAQAHKYVAFILKYQKLIESRVKDIKPENKATVYFEGYGDYSTVAKGTGGDELVTNAGGINIAGQENTKYPKVSGEWVLQKNPRVIVKTVSSNNKAMGEGYTDIEAVKAVYYNLISRPGWTELAAVKNKNVILLAQDIGTTPEGCIIGMLYMVKTMYPDKFSDIDPYEIYKQMKKEFYHTEPKGIIAYPG